MQRARSDSERRATSLAQVVRFKQPGILLNSESPAHPRVITVPDERLQRRSRCWAGAARGRRGGWGRCVPAGGNAGAFVLRLAVKIF